MRIKTFSGFAAQFKVSSAHLETLRVGSDFFAVGLHFGIGFIICGGHRYYRNTMLQAKKQPHVII